MGQAIVVLSFCGNACISISFFFSLLLNLYQSTLLQFDLMKFFVVGYSPTSKRIYLYKNKNNIIKKIEGKRCIILFNIFF
jgi:hypothetical protein